MAAVWGTDDQKSGKESPLEGRVMQVQDDDALV